MTLPPAKPPPKRSAPPPAPPPDHVTIEVTEDEPRAPAGDASSDAAPNVDVEVEVDPEPAVESETEATSENDGESRPSIMGRNEELVSVLKTIAGMMRSGQADEAHGEYARLFADPSFDALRPDEQRQVLRLMVIPKVKSAPSESVLEAHRSAMPKLEALAATPGEAVDYELLGVAQVTLGNVDAAREAFASALAMERAKSPGSELVGTLMKRMSEI